MEGGENKSLLIFSSEAYNVEMGIWNQLFPQERDETPGCLFVPDSQRHTELYDYDHGQRQPSSHLRHRGVTNFMRMLSSAYGSPATPSSGKGTRRVRGGGVCTHWHTPSFHSRRDDCESGSSTSPSAALSKQTVNLFSDLLVHHMGKGLADGITQGGKGPDEFRTAPLWGVGQRYSSYMMDVPPNLVEAIRAHKSRGSEANKVIKHFERLSTQEQQEIIDFLRTL